MLKDFINISRSKVDTAKLPIKIASIPRVVQMSLTSSTGVTSQCIVNCGQRVEEGEVIALAVGAGTRNIHASELLISPEASGRLAVRATEESNFRSNKSLIIQPAARIRMDPEPNSKNKKGSGKPPALGAIDNAHHPGKSNNHVPMGRSMRASLR